MVKCDICGKKLPEKSVLLQHMIDVHQTKSKIKFECSTCNKQFANKRYLRQHEFHTNHKNWSSVEQIDETHKCDICSKLFTNQRLLKQHVRNMHSDRVAASSMCPVCGLTFKTLSGFNRHHKIEHQSEKMKSMRARNRSAPATMWCPLCGKGFSSGPSFRAHLKIGHRKDGGNDLWLNLVHRICFKCNRVFPSVDCMKEHRAVHNSFQCSVCKQFMTSEQSLQYHMEIHSNKARPFQCMVIFRLNILYESLYLMFFFKLGMRCNIYT